jgi:small ligand-binding sensory domain FIST
MRHPSWRLALTDALEELGLPCPGGATVDLAFFFASADFSNDFEEMLGRVHEATGARILIGCSGQGVIGPGQEIEEQPALSLMVLRLPDAKFTAVHIVEDEIERGLEARAWHRLTNVGPDDVNGWLIFADPFTIDAESLIGVLSSAYPGVPLVGGLASGNLGQQRTHVFANGRVYDHGAVALAVGSPYRLRTIVSQGAAPIGRPWTITGAQGNVIETIGSRPAYEVLVDTVRGLPPQLQRRIQRNLLVGLAMDEHREEFGRGDFLIRNLVGVVQETGALAVSALPRVGQTLQFQLRDPRAADQDLRQLLERARQDLGGRQPVAALLCSCNGRGAGLFGAPHHDARAIAQGLGAVPLAGLFCNGEIGPVGGRHFLHGFTASIALLVRDEPDAAPTR